MTASVLGILGTGLIGASIGLRARENGWHVLGYDADGNASAQALSCGAIDEIASRQDVLARANVIALATPPQATIAELETLGATAANLVFDVASVKVPVAQAAAGVKNFVASHPMAGREQSGPGAARAELFVERPWAYVPTGDAALDERFRAFVTMLGARPFAIDAALHDRTVALTSHLPQLLAFAFVEQLLSLPPEAREHFSGPVARELRRIGASDRKLWQEIFELNHTNLSREARALSRTLQDRADKLDSVTAKADASRSVVEEAGAFDSVMASVAPKARSRATAPTTSLETVGFQGESGAFSEEAARALLGDVTCTGYPTFEELVAAVDRTEVATGVIPCENAIHGPIARTYDLLAAHPHVRIIDEAVHAIAQQLIGIPGATLDAVRTVRSHPVALEQCRIFLSTLPGAAVEPVNDTAAAVRRMMDAGDKSVAAIGSTLAAQLYGGEILARNVHDDPENVTRFFVVARDGKPRRPPTRACVAFQLAHRPGSLHDALGALAERGLNMRSLLARPLRARPFEYAFYIEFECPNSEALDGLLGSIDGSANVLGFY